MASGGMLTTLILLGVTLYVGVNFVLPLISKGVSGVGGVVNDARGIVGFAGYQDGYGQDF